MPSVCLHELCYELVKKNVTVSIAESCTGGYMSSAITNIPGASRCLVGSFVVYSRESKEILLGVPKGVNLCSIDCVTAMNRGLKKVLGGDLQISISGKINGSVFYDIFYEGQHDSHELRLSGTCCRAIAKYWIVRTVIEAVLRKIALSSSSEIFS